MSFQFRRGAAAIEEAATRKSGGGARSFIPRLRWREDGESHYVLVLTDIDNVTTALLHEWIPVGKGERADGEEYTKWEDFISRKDPAIGEDYDDLSDRLERDAKERCLGVMVELEPVTEKVGNRTKVTSFTVKTSTFTRKTDDGEEEVVQPEISLVVESAITLWGAVGSLDQSRGPITELPVEIIRRGKDQNTRYDLFPLDVPVDLSPIVAHLDGLSYLSQDEDIIDDIIAQVSAAGSDLEAAQVVADAMLTKRLNEMADGERYTELVEPLQLEDMPKKFGKGKGKGKAKKERPARVTRREVAQADRPEFEPAEPSEASKSAPEAEAPAEPVKEDRFAALKARVEG
jgi:hypothetical protein